MLYLYLDESGDLGFDFVNKKPSVHFTICVVAVRGRDNDRALSKAVRGVIRRKLSPRPGTVSELKGNALPLDVKAYFYGKAEKAGFSIHSATLNKVSVYRGHNIDRDRLYNYLSNLALESVKLEDAAVRVIMTIDRSKPRREIAEFNSYILRQIKGRLDPSVPLDIVHVLSQESCGLQAADLFAWGIFRKYEHGDGSWYDTFRRRVISDRLYAYKKEEERAA